MQADRERKARAKLERAAADEVLKQQARTLACSAPHCASSRTVGFHAHIIACLKPAHVPSNSLTHMSCPMQCSIHTPLPCMAMFGLASLLNHTVALACSKTERLLKNRQRSVV